MPSPDVPPPALDTLRRTAREAVRHADAPYSRAPDAAALLLADGRLVPGVRVESASFSLTVPALLGAVSAAHALAPGVAIVAAALSRPLRPDERPFLADLGLTDAHGDDALAAPGALPDAGLLVSPFLDADAPATPERGVALARLVSGRARVPASAFPVGCVARVGGRLVPGVNVEFSDWGRILCAERGALATLAAFGLGAPDTLWLACARAACSPCGACRQLLTERAPGATLWMDDADGVPFSTTPEVLLPGAFSGAGLVLL